MNCEHIVLTGDRPTGHLHLGHFIGSLKSRLKLQEQYKCYVMVADIQALTDNFEHPEKISANICEVCKDYLAVGLDPLKSAFFVQSKVPELSELTIFYLNLVSLSRLERNPTVKAELKQKKISESLPVGFLCYPISQAADITAFKATLIPVGEDQLPMIELSNEVVRKFNRIYNSTILKESVPILSNTQRLVGIDGKAKASKSLNNAIFLSDSSEIIKNKVYSMYTDPGHIKITDPGKIEGNVVFAYLDAFFDEKDELDSLKNQYKQGGLGDSVLKALLNDTLQQLIAPIREKRESLTNSYVNEILKEGSLKARKKAQETLSEVKNAIGLNYADF